MSPSFFSPVSFFQMSPRAQTHSLSLELWVIFPTLHRKPSSNCVAACLPRDCPPCWLPSKGMALSFLYFFPQGGCQASQLVYLRAFF